MLEKEIFSKLFGTPHEHYVPGWWEGTFEVGVPPACPLSNCEARDKPTTPI